METGPAKTPMKSGGGWKAIRYTLQTANRVGWLPLWRAMRSRNASRGRDPDHETVAMR